MKHKFIEVGIIYSNSMHSTNLIFSDFHFGYMYPTSMSRIMHKCFDKVSTQKPMFGATHLERYDQT